MRTRFAAVGLLVIVASGCARKSEPARQDIVRIVDRGFLTNAPVYIADAEGYFADEGIRLQVSEPPRTSSLVIPLVERGDIDVMLTGVTAGLYAAVARGAKLRIVADRGHVSATGCDYNGIMARRGAFGRDSATAAGLRGKRFSLGPAGMATYVADRFLATGGLTTADLDMVRLGETVEAQALDAGSIDAMHVSEPYLSKLRAEGHMLIGPSRVYAPGVQYAVVIYGPSLTVARRDVGQRFMKAYLRGVRKFQEGSTTRNVEIIAARTGIDPAVLKTLCMPTINADGALNDSTLLDFQRWAARTGNLSNEVGIDGGLDRSFARQAAKELGITPSPK